MLDFLEGQRIKNILGADDDADDLIGSENRFEFPVSDRFREILDNEVVDRSAKRELGKVPKEKKRANCMSVLTFKTVAK